MVTGREGQVSRSLAERGTGHELVFAGRPEFDLADASSIERTVAAVNPALVISAAAYTSVDKAEDEPALAMAVNGDAPGALARSAAKIGARMIHLSTDYVFDGSLDRPWREDEPVGPLGVYGATKLAGEQAVVASNATYAIVRTAWVYSPFGSNFVKTMLRLAETRSELAVVEDQFGNPTSAFDIADALMAVIAAWQIDPGKGTNAVYHVAGSGGTHWAGFARAIFAESTCRGGPTAKVIGIPSSAYPTLAKRPANSRLDTTRFANTFGYSAPPWRDSLHGTISRLIS
nr:dTDP-4-dehydrorhamnose reductase [Sphingomonas tagetis]